MFIEQCVCGANHTSAHGDGCLGDKDIPMSRQHLKELLRYWAIYPPVWCPVNLTKEAINQLNATRHN